MPAHDAITVRWAETGDRAAIAGLVEQTKRHYGEEPAITAAMEAAVAGWLEAKPGHALFAIALANDAAAGYASEEGHRSLAWPNRNPTASERCNAASVGESCVIFLF